ncbi:hypothetical protein BESB_030060 [Besnoitia besnoiti]|uniref:F-box domain-containing protein n=1 Tax=Besnoitia besnoiti TaxID=94643 RepID=A0A2A9M6X5_BESBE|nr:hypothetical protein BESB_030060 [Besnoitia besnoiti]PFH31132.1 hypothetical protein BESB_030060 [Besnoitia besnoiti]
MNPPGDAAEEILAARCGVSQGFRGVAVCAPPAAATRETCTSAAPAQPDRKGFSRVFPKPWPLPNGADELGEACSLHALLSHAAQPAGGSQQDASRVRPSLTAARGGRSSCARSTCGSSEGKNNGCEARRERARVSPGLPERGRRDAEAPRSLSPTCDLLSSPVSSSSSYSCRPRASPSASASPASPSFPSSSSSSAFSAPASASALPPPRPSLTDALPDDLLCEVLLFLPFTEVGETVPLVSRRFCHLALLPFIWTFFYASAFSSPSPAPPLALRADGGGTKAPCRDSGPASPSGAAPPAAASLPPGLATAAAPCPAARSGGRARAVDSEESPEDDAVFAAARAAAEEICFVEMEAAMRLGRERAALLSLQRQAVLPAAAPAAAAPPRSPAETVSRAAAAWSLVPGGEERGGAREGVCACASSSASLSPPSRSSAGPLAHPPRAVAALLAQCHVQRLHRLYALRDKQVLLASQQRGAHSEAFSADLFPPQAPRGGAGVRSDAATASRRTAAEADGGARARRPGGSPGRGPSGASGGRPSSGFSLNDYLFFKDEDEGAATATHARETEAQRPEGATAPGGPPPGEAVVKAQPPGAAAPPVGAPEGPEDAPVAESPKGGAEASKNDGARRAGDNEDEEEASAATAAAAAANDGPDGGECSGARGVEQEAEEEADMDEDQFLDLLFGPSASSSGDDSEGSSPWAPVSSPDERASASPGFGCGARAEAGGGLLTPAQVAARRFAERPPSSLEEALGLWKGAWGAAEEVAGSGTDRGASGVAKKPVHVCHGRSCDIWSVPQFDLYLCRDSGQVHCCGLRCDRMVPSDSDLGFLVCPVSGLMVDPALVNVWTARERRSARPADGGSEDFAALFGELRARKEGDALRMRSAEVMNELMVATYATELQAAGGAGEEDDEMAGVGGMFGRFWTAGYLAENEGELLLRSKKRCKFT